MAKFWVRWGKRTTAANFSYMYRYLFLGETYFHVFGKAIFRTVFERSILAIPIVIRSVQETS